MSMTTGMRYAGERWRRAARALKDEDQKFGIMLADAIERRKGPEYAMFDDPLEATFYLLLVQMIKELDRKYPLKVPDTMRRTGPVPE
jgi:hypothetical protein